VIIFQVVLALGMLTMSLLLFMMVRQIGLLSRRIRHTKSSKRQPSLEIGSRSPHLAFESYDRSGPIRVPVTGEGESFLLFASFSCTLCRPVLEQVAELPAAMRDRMVLMMLDTSIADRFAGEIAGWKLGGFRIVEAYSMATDFRIEHAPVIFVIDEQGEVRAVEAIFGFDELREFLGMRAVRRPAPTAESGSRS